MFNRFIVGILQYMPEGLVWIFSKRYIAGKKREDAFRVTGDLNSQGIKVSLDLLGEFQTRSEKIDYYKAEYIKTILDAAYKKLDISVSVKPTMFGLLLDRELCYKNIREIILEAVSCNYFVQIDMEDSQCTDAEIEIFNRLYNEFPRHVGFVFQAYMRRTLNDIKALAVRHPQKDLGSIRICKGIYVEPKEIAYKDKQEIRDRFLEAVEYMFQRNINTAIATHDKKVVEGTYRLIEKYRVPSDKFEFQMLYGVTPKLRNSIVKKGYAMRVYVPYGEDWYNYCTRRLKENPYMMWDLLKALVVRN
ncbi:MAG: proline dehydrogenase family protein [Bacteroidales bacterium]|nr:proline dehydrogenase family protein [Bacteroidales bacterium]